MRVILLLCLCAPATAAAQSVAVMPVEAPESEADGQRIHATLKAAVAARAGLTDKGSVKLNVPEARISFSCFDEDVGCMSEVGAILEADQLIWGKLSQTADGWTLSLNHIDVRERRVVRRETVKAVAGAGGMRTLEAAARVFVSGEPMPQRAPAKTLITIESDPTGAEIFVDNARMGRTPASVELVRGEYTLELRHEDSPGNNTQRITVGVEPRTVRVPLVAKGIEAPPPPTASRTNLWVAVGTGVVAVGAATFGAIKGLEMRQLEDDAAAATNPNHYNDLASEHEDAQLQANVALGIAGVSAAVSGYFFYRHFSQSDVAVVPTGTGVSAVLRF